jgi:hypothetical protein
MISSIGRESADEASAAIAEARARARGVMMRA